MKIFGMDTDSDFYDFYDFYDCFYDWYSIKGFFFVGGKLGRK